MKKIKNEIKQLNKYMMMTAIEIHFEQVLKDFAILNIILISIGLFIKSI